MQARDVMVGGVISVGPDIPVQIAADAMVRNCVSALGRAGMIPREDECRRKAKEADAMAETARDQAAREILREVAELWHKLADQVERRGW